MTRRGWRWEVEVLPFGGEDYPFLRLAVYTHDSTLSLSRALPDLTQMWDGFQALAYIVVKMTDEMTRAIPTARLGDDDAPE